MRQSVRQVAEGTPRARYGGGRIARGTGNRVLEKVYREFIK